MCISTYTCPSPYRALSLADWGEDVAVGLFAPGPLKYAMMEELTADSLSDFLQVHAHEIEHVHVHVHSCMLALRSKVLSW